MGAWKCMVLSYTHPYTNTVKQSRTRTRLCVPFRQSLLFADGPLVAPQLATKSIPLQLATMPLTGPVLSHPWREEAVLGHTNATTFMHLMSYSTALSQACLTLLLPSFDVKFSKLVKGKLSPRYLKKRIGLWKCVVLWKSGLKQRGAGCLSEVLCTRTHTCIHTHTHTYTGI